jgi:hypothetical protein
MWKYAAVVGLLVACGGEGDGDGVITGETDSDDLPNGSGLEVNYSQFGNPTWGLAGFQMFVAPMDATTGDCLIGSNHTYDGSVWLPNVPHAEPFDDEIADAADDCGFAVTSVITSEQFTGPSGVILGLVLVGLETGSTPDYESGSTIPGDKFPMVVDGDVRRDLLIVDSDQDRSYPDPMSLGYLVDGHSHVPLLFQMNMDRMPAGASAPGDYSFRLVIRDASSQVDPTGYDVEVPFRVE